MARDRIIIKVGGSLFDLPELGPRLRRWLETVDAASIWLLPGGGRAADAIRHLDHVHNLGEETAHWLALRSLTLNAHFLQSLFPEAAIITATERDWTYHEGLALVDAHAFARADEARPGKLPHMWDAASDTVAARLALVSGARKLVLLKSVAIPPGMDWQSASEKGYVDPYFPQVLCDFDDIEVEMVDFRTLKI